MIQALYVAQAILKNPEENAPDIKEDSRTQYK